MLVSKKKYEELERKTREAVQNLSETIKLKDEKITKLEKELNEIEKRLNKEFNDERAIAYKTIELEFKGKYNDELQKVKDEYQEKMNKGIEENFTKLKESLVNIHEEGNANTKYLEKFSLAMMDTMKSSSSLRIDNNEDK